MELRISNYKPNNHVTFKGDIIGSYNFWGKQTLTNELTTGSLKDLKECFEVNKKGHSIGIYQRTSFITSPTDCIGSCYPSQKQRPFEIIL